MAIGDYDEAEHERREKKTVAIETDDADQRTVFEGSLEFDSGESTEELLAKFAEIKGK